MNQFPAGISSSPVSELHFFRDWKQSFSIVREAASEAPKPFMCVIGSVVGQLLLPFFEFAWGLLEFIAIYFVLAQVIQTTYKYLFPKSGNGHVVFPDKPQIKMLGAAILVNTGTTIGAFFFIIPGIWFAAIHMFAQPIIVIEGCGVMEALSRSRQLMAGNIMRIAPYCFFWPLAVAAGIGIPIAIVAGIFYAMVTSIFHGDAAREIIVNIIRVPVSLICLALGLTISTLVARAYIHLMHLSGNRTAIEQQMENNIGQA